MNGIYIHWTDTLLEGERAVTDGPFDSLQVSVGGYDRATNTSIRDSNGDEIGRLEGARGWIRTDDGSEWSDFVIDGEEELA